MTDLGRLLDPQTIAIVGLSDDPTKHGGRVLASLRKLGYPGAIWGVHPRRPSVDGVTMVASLSELEASPDVVACAVPAGALPQVINDAGTVSAGVAVVFAGGFSEAGSNGRNAQAALITGAGAAGVRLLGPNSGGVIRPSVGMAVSFLTCLDRPAAEIRSGPVGLVTQSGGTGSYLHNLAAERGSGLGVSISVGNEADLGIADGIRALVELDEIETIALVLETVRDGPAFVAGVRDAIAAGKPVVACRIGSSERGLAMTTTHTGAMARPAYILDGVLDSLGVTMVETPGELLDVTEVMASAHRPSGDRVGVVTHSGGIAILLTDLADRHGVHLPPPGKALRTRLDPLLDHGTADNPLDMGGIIGGPERFGQVVDAFVESDEYDTVVAVSTAHPRAHTVERVQGLLTASERVLHLWMAGDVGAEGLAMLREADRPVTTEPRAMMRALAGLARFDEVRALPESAGAESADASPAPAGPLTEHAAKQFLAEWGLAVPEGGLARSPEEAAGLAERLGGTVVVKVNSPDVTHKTEVGGLRLGVEGGPSARSAFEEVVGNAQAALPDATINGALVERQRSGFELIVGGLHDPVFGALVLVGMGGVAAESLGPPAIAPAPLDQSGARRMISRATGLAGALDRHDSAAAERLSTMLVIASRAFVASNLAQFEINPLAWTGTQWEALDAVVLGHPT